MNQFDFFPFHNRHIRFALDKEIHSGFLADDAFNKEGKTKQTDYSFVPTNKMKEWQEYQRLGDRQKMNALTTVVDIAKISWARYF